MGSSPPSLAIHWSKDLPRLFLVVQDLLPNLLQLLFGSSGHEPPLCNTLDHQGVGGKRVSEYQERLMGYFFIINITSQYHKGVSFPRIWVSQSTVFSDDNTQFWMIWGYPPSEETSICSILRVSMLMFDRLWSDNSPEKHNIYMREFNIWRFPHGESKMPCKHRFFGGGLEKIFPFTTKKWSIRLTI